MAIQDLFDQIIDQYRLEEHLFDKKFTDVYLAYDIEEQRTVALEVLKPAYAANSAFAEAFVTRMETLAKAKHPNLPQIFYVGHTPAQQPYVAREYVAGYPLTERIAQLVSQGLPVYSIYALQLVRQIAEALALAERLELFHTTLSPHNIVLKTVKIKSDDAVVLVDLGIPADPTGVEALTEPGQADYLSPEQRAQKPINGRSHIYSLGVMLFEILTGQRPSRQIKVWEAPMRTLTRRKTLLEKARHDLSPEMYALVDRCIRTAVWQRYQTMAEFIQALDQVLAAENQRLRSDMEVITETARPWRVYLLALVILFTCFGAGVAVTQSFLPSRSPNVTSIAAIELADTATPGGIIESVATIIAPTVVLPTAASHTLTPTAGPTATPSSTATSSASSTPSATPTAVPTPQAQIRILYSSVSVRTGPGIDYDIASYLVEGDVVAILGRNTDGNIWYNVLLADGSRGWLSAGGGELVGDTEELAIPVAVTIPPWPTRTITPSPTMTPTATPTAVDDGSGGGNQPKPTSTEPPLP